MDSGKPMCPATLPSATPLTKASLLNPTPWARNTAGPYGDRSLIRFAVMVFVHFDTGQDLAFGVKLAPVDTPRALRAHPAVDRLHQAQELLQRVTKDGFAFWCWWRTR